jgi:hypothetical protein
VRQKSSAALARRTFRPSLGFLGQAYVFLTKKSQAQDLVWFAAIEADTAHNWARDKVRQKPCHHQVIE